MLKIRMIDSSPSDDIYSHVLVHMLKEITKTEISYVHNRIEPVDIEFVSNFTFTNNFQKLILRTLQNFSSNGRESYRRRVNNGFRFVYRSKTKIRIWFSGENIRPPIDTFDLKFSHDNDDYSLRNVFFPYWMYRINWFNNYSKFEIYPKIGDLLKQRKPEKRNISAITFASSYNYHRQKAIFSAEKVFRVEKYGAFFNRAIKSKRNIANNFGLQICGENDLYPNYVTEKLQEAWMCRNVPIWSGLDDKHFFNPEAFINITGMESEQITDVLANLSMEELMYRQSQPLLNSEYDIEKPLSILKNLLRNIL